MNYIELSNAFDILSNKFSTENSAPLQLFDEYEKSVFVTMAAEQIVNGIIKYYDANEFVRTALKDLVKSTNLTPLSINSGVDGRSMMFEDLQGLKQITFERLSSGGSEMKVFPITDDSRNFNVENPFRVANKEYALRVRNSSVDGIELIVDAGYMRADASYHVKYLTDSPVFILSESIAPASINGAVSNLNVFAEAPLSRLHNVILNRAVMLAHASSGADINVKKFIDDISIIEIQTNL